ncbi:MAG: type II toxin-antitoxin system prevent-host-death family antitoxin [Nocardioides sp.]
MPLGKARDRLSELVADVERTHERIYITVHGRPAAVLISADDLASLEGLPEKIATACAELIFGPLAENPRRVGEPLRDELAGLHSARRGDYRVVYAIVGDQHAVEILHIDRRSDVYR